MGYSLRLSAQVPKSQVKSSKKVVKAQSAVVGLEGATVYKEPDFDSQVQIQLEPGYKITVSRMAVPGRGGLGMFYRVKYAEQRFGYIPDTEVITEFKKNTPVPKKNPDFEKVEDLREKELSGKPPVLQTRYLGLSIGRFLLQESYLGKKWESQSSTFGLRYSGVGVWGDQIPLDFQFQFSPTAPEFYERANGSPASGFWFIVDAQLMFLIWEKRDIAILAGAGPLLRWSQFRVKEGLDYLDKESYGLGALGELGLSYRYRNFLVRVDARYHIEKNSYPSGLLSLQHRY